MEVDLASHLFREGCFLILLDVPQGTEIGIDYNLWNVGPKFKGIKMIPPGFHLICYSSVSKDGRETGPRSSFFHWFKPKEILVRVWDPKNEDLTEQGVDDSLIERLRTNLHELDQFIGPYPYDQLKKWLSLTNHVTPSLMERIQPYCGVISCLTRLAEDRQATPVPLAPPTSEVPRTNTSVGYFAGVGHFNDLVETDGKEGVRGGDKKGGITSSEHFLVPQKDEAAALRFSLIPKTNYPDGATPTQISRCNMDLSYILEQLLLGYNGEAEEQESCLLGELQLSFVCFMISQVYDAFEQWKRLVKILCLSELALSSRPTLFLDFISVLHYHLKEVPEQFFVDIVTKNNFLTTTLQVFFSNVQDGDSLSERLKEKASQFKTNLTKRFKWDFSIESEEENLPTIVSNEEQPDSISS